MCADAKQIGAECADMKRRGMRKKAQYWQNIF